MKKNIITLLVLTLSVGVFAQVVKPGIGIGTKTPSPSAILEVKASDKGVLIPRMALTDLTKFHLQGNTVVGAAEANEGILIYNDKAVVGTETAKAIPVGFYYWTNDGTPRWELVTSQSVTEKILDRITTVEKSVGLTPGGGEGEGGVKPGVNPGEGGGTVIYRPGKDGKPGEPGKSGTIVIKDETGKDLEIDLADLLRESQTNTFFRVVAGTKKITVNEAGVPIEKDIAIQKLYYFGEKAIADWLLLDKANLAKDIEKEMPIDAVGVLEVEISSLVSHNFREIFTNENTKETIKEVLESVEGNVTIGLDDKGNTAILVGDGKGESKVFDLNQLETKTRFDKTKGDGTTAGSADVKTLPADATAKGKILYTYYGEDKDDKGVQIPSYIDITSDFLTSIKENKEIREQIVNVISNPNGPEITDPTEPGYVDPIIPGGGGTVTDPTKPTDPTTPGGDDGKTGNENNTNWGNVYYGPVDPKDPKKGNVLYTLDKDGNKKYIDIAANIINEITNNSTLVDKIKEITTVRVEGAAAGEAGKVVETGEEIGGKKVYKGLTKVTVKGETGVGYNSTFTDAIKISDEVKFGRLLKAIVLDENGQVLVNTVTDVEKVGNGFAFSFGSGEFYVSLVDKSYEVIYEFIAE